MSLPGDPLLSAFRNDPWPPSAFPSPVVRTRRRRVAAVVVPAVSRDLPLYWDCGDPVRVCIRCAAVFWFDERVVSLSRVNNPVYSQCCRGGSVVLPSSPLPPTDLINIYRQSHFKRNIRAYNSMFAMTSFGARIDEGINMGRGPYTFKVSGQISHWIGSLCPHPPDRPRFLQLYVYDAHNDVENRLQLFSGQAQTGLDSDIVVSLRDILLRYNEYVRTFRNVVRIADENSLEEYSVRLYNNVRDVRYVLPQGGSLGAIVVADDPNACQYDIIIRSRDGLPQRISKLHPSYMPLQYPLLFPFGEGGWNVRLKLMDRNTGVEVRKALTVNKYYSYVIHSRSGRYSLALNGGRLFQQYLVDAYLCVEENRLDFIQTHQNQLRSEYVSGVYDAISRGDSEGKQIGKRIFLPATFVGGPRYMYKHYQDALALCRVYGNPQYFITFICNVQWPEIVRFLESRGLGHSENRPDIIARVFRIKVSQFIDFLKEYKPFGAVTAYLYTIEFQKRGLPHCHTLLWVDTASKIRLPTDVDKYITAELPDPLAEPILYSTISNCMLHGPCGLLNPTAPCMYEGNCKKKFPKPFSANTYFDKDGYVHYKRGDAAFHTLPSGIPVHNGFVVPYNKRLSSRFNAHINVEYCGWNMVIKYLFKYISKGADRVAFALHKANSAVASSSSPVTQPVDEVQNFVDGRFICPHEAAWRFLNFPIHERQPAVQPLCVHLEDMQNITFDDNASLQEMVNNENFGRTTLTSWLSNNRWDLDGRSLTYVEYSSMFRWDPVKRDWVYRTQDVVRSVGRLVYVHPTSGELFFLRMLLCHQKGCRIFAEIQTVNGIRYDSYQLACEALGLIGDDREWLTAFLDASNWASSSELRTLFYHLVMFCDVTKPIDLWDQAWSKMGDDIRHAFNNSTMSAHSVVTDDLVRQHILLELEKLFNGATPTKSLVDFGLPLPDSSMLAGLQNRLLLEETMYDTLQLQRQHSEMIAKLNPDQLQVYNRVRTDYELGKQSLVFVYGHGGTGKTFLWSTILAYFRSMGKVVLAVAASGIASLLLPNGRTAHSRFNIPIELSDTCMCDIKKKTQLAELLEQTTMIIWDEATMADRRCFECVDRSLRDILGNKHQPFGGKSVLLGGDFRQTLPVKRKKSHQEIIASTLPNSYLWSYFTVYKLSHNMRLSVGTGTDMATSIIADFGSWLLDIGNGLMGTPDPVRPDSVSFVRIPDKFLIMDDVSGLEQLIDFVYGADILRNPTPESLRSRAIVCPKNDTTEDINNIILDMTHGSATCYSSTDSISPHTLRTSNFDLLYPQEYLNQLTFPGLPLHNLKLKKNVPIVLLRNMNQNMGMCNGTRLIVTELLPTVIEAAIITGTSIGKRVYIPRIKLIHHDPELPFIFARKQFPCRLCYAMTINKSQGQSLEKIGVYLPLPIFGHGQLYVALSRATSPGSIKVLILDECGKPTHTTKNIVFRSFLTQIHTSQNTEQ